MRFTSKVARDTKIPNEYIPLIILHWWDVHYYGGGLSPLDMRKFLESKLKQGLYSSDAVKTWISRALAWEHQLKMRDASSVSRFLAQYYQIALAA